jgi:hypothetical protein
MIAEDRIDSAEPSMRRIGLNPQEAKNEKENREKKRL